MDDLDSDLFGDSLGRKTSNTKTAKPTTPSRNKPSNPTTPEKRDKTETRGDSTRKTAEKKGGSSSPSGKKFSIDKYDNLGKLKKKSNFIDTRLKGTTCGDLTNFT